MTEKLTKKLLVKLIKEEINKSQLLYEITDEELSKLGFNTREIRQLQNALTSNVASLRRSANRTIQARRAGDAMTAGAAAAIEKGLELVGGLGKQKQADAIQKGQVSDAEREKLRKAYAREYGNDVGSALGAKRTGRFADMDASDAQAVEDEGSIFDQAIELYGTPKDAPKKKRRGKRPYFFRKYRKAGIDKAFAKEFGGTDRAAFDKFYDRVNMPKTRKARDYQFGPAHFRRFQKLKLGKAYDSKFKRAGSGDAPPAETPAEKAAADKMEKDLASPREKELLDKIRKNAATAPTVPARLAIAVALGRNVSAGQVQAAGGSTAVLRAAKAYAKRQGMSEPTTVKT